MPLFDSAVLVAAREAGFAAREGLDLTLTRETSWANIRDRIAIGHFDLAHMLGPMPLACNLGLTPLAAEVIVPFALGLGGNCVTVSNAVGDGMTLRGALPDLDPSGTGLALGTLIRDRAQAGRERLRFAVVHPHSGHGYELRYWLAACGAPVGSAGASLVLGRTVSSTVRSSTRTPSRLHSASGKAIPADAAASRLCTAQRLCIVPGPLLAL